MVNNNTVRFSSSSASSVRSPSAASTPRSPVRFDDEGQGTPARQPARWAVFAGMALIGLQLLTFDVVLERHARRAQAQAANYVAVTLQPRPDAVAQSGPAAAQPLLLAGN